MNFEVTNPNLVIGVAAVILVLLIVATVLILEKKRRERTRDLRLRFGHEYDLLLKQTDSRKRAEDKLLAREKRVEMLKIRELNPNERAQFLTAWDKVQARFIDHPRGAVIDADELINALLKARGFPSDRFEQRAADLSVGHAHLVEQYRAANEITVRAGKNATTTEELRMAMLYYHALFEDLVQAETRVELKQAV